MPKKYIKNNFIIFLWSGRKSSLLKSSNEWWNWAFKANVEGAWLCSKHVGSRALPLTSVMSLELASYNIRVNAIAPSMFHSELRRNFTNRNGSPFFELIRYLIHDSSNYVTGKRGPNPYWCSHLVFPLTNLLLSISFYYLWRFHTLTTAICHYYKNKNVICTCASGMCFWEV